MVLTDKEIKLFASAYIAQVLEPTENGNAKVSPANLELQTFDLQSPLTLRTTFYPSQRGTAIC